MFLSRIYEYFVGNKAKGRILKRVFQENKARQIFRKTNISNPLIRTCFKIHPFALLPTNRCFKVQDYPFSTPLKFVEKLTFETF